MNIDTYIHNLHEGIRVNDVINLGVLHKSKGLFGNIKKEMSYGYYIVTNVTPEIITLFVRIGYSPKIGLCTRKKLKELFDDADHILVTRAKVIYNGDPKEAELEMEELINETIDE